MLTHQHLAAGQLHRVIVTRGVVGWDVRVECDDRLVRQATYTDWHRVERAIFAVNQIGQAGDAHSTNR